MKSLRVQFVITIALVLGLGLGILVLLTGSQMVSMTMDAFVSRQELATVAVASGLSETLRGRDGAGTDMTALQLAVNASAGALKVSLSIVDPTGTVLVTTAGQDTAPLANEPEVTAALNGRVTNIVRADHLYTAAPILHDNRDLVGAVVIGGSLAPVETQLRLRWLMLLGATAGVLLVAGGIGWWLAGRMVRPLAGMRTVAQQMAGGNLSVRANISKASSEVASLGAAFNEMAERIQETMRRQQEFVANASHELRAPLAAMKLRTESLVDGSASGERARQYVVDVDQEITQLGKMVAELLALSRIDSHSFAEPTQTINVSTECNNCIRQIQPLLHSKAQQFAAHIAPNIPPLFINASDLRLMVSNLLDNAVKYTPPNGAINLEATWTNHTLTIEVQDNGEGIPPADIPRVTDRFFRVDRAHHTPRGTGLGLSLVMETARQYRGDLVLESSGIPGKGTCARLVLRPRAQANP